MMTAELKDHFFKELQSFKSPPARQVAPVPKVGESAPQHELLELSRDKPTIIVFLRHCGCPCKRVLIADSWVPSFNFEEIHCRLTLRPLFSFRSVAEKAFRELTAFSATHAGHIACIAVSHSSQEATDKWVPQVGGEWEVSTKSDPPIPLS